MTEPTVEWSRTIQQSVRLALGTASALGLARFAYGLLVPAMREDLGWSLSRSGALSTANGLGYLAGALMAAVIIQRLGATTTFRVGMVVTALALAMTSASSDYSMLLAMRAIAGVSGAFVFIAGGVIASHLATNSASAAPVTVYFSGAGVGIVFGGGIIPLLLDQRPENWPLAWISLATAAGAAAAVSWTAADFDGRGSAGGTGRRQVRPLWRIAAAYTLFAAGYIAYITFLSAFLADHHASTTQVAFTWMMLGIGVVVGPVLWNRPMEAWSGSWALAVLLAVLGGAAALAIPNPAPLIVVVSAVSYGITFMSVPAAVTTLIRERTRPSDWAPTLAAFTALFAAGQTVGPWISGLLADHTTSGATLAWTAVLCFAAAVLSVTNTPRRDTF
jgi:predicted MFS family arabinose efflux permease